MRFILSTGSLWSYSIERCVAFAAAAGFDGIEVMIDQRWETRQAEYLTQLSQQHGQPIVAVHSPFSPVVPGWPRDEVGRITQALRLAEAVGACVLVHHLPRQMGMLTLSVGTNRYRLPIPGWNPDAPYIRWLMTEHARVQASTAVRLCIENMPASRVGGRRVQGYLWNTPDLITWHRSITLDTTHLATWGIDAADAYPQLRGRIEHVHLSNYDGREHRRPKQGRLNLARLLAALAADNYSGAISLELYPDVLGAGQPDAVIVDLLRQSLGHCRAWADGSVL